MYVTRKDGFYGPVTHQGIEVSYKILPRVGDTLLLSTYVPKDYFSEAMSSQEECDIRDALCAGPHEECFKVVEVRHHVHATDRDGHTPIIPTVVVKPWKEWQVPLAPED